MTIQALELEPTKENLLNALYEDLINRNDSVWHFSRFCNEQDGKCSIAIDGGWGSGKTFFVKHVQMLMDSFNSCTTMLTEEEKMGIQRLFSGYKNTNNEDVEFEPEVCVYYDAWINDNDCDPMLSLVNEIIQYNGLYYPFKKGGDCLEIAASIADYFCRNNISAIVKQLKNKDYLDEIKTQNDVHNQIEKFLETLLYEQGNRLIVFIDELDRCKPEYAVKLLERIKHYFSNDRITFVFSINAEELQHTIKRFYGEDFDACRYLDRYFDYKIALPEADLAKYYNYIGLGNSHIVYEAVCRRIIEYYSFSLREIEKYYRIAKNAPYKIVYNQSDFSFSYGRALKFSMYIILPIIIGLRMKDTSKHNAFIAGSDPEPLLEIMGDGSMAIGICSMLLNSSETYQADSTEKKQVLLSDKLKEAYYALFNNGKVYYGQSITVGSCEFNNKIKEEVIKASSMVSKYSRY